MGNEVVVGVGAPQGSSWGLFGGHMQGSECGDVLAVEYLHANRDREWVGTGTERGRGGHGGLPQAQR